MKSSHYFFSLFLLLFVFSCKKDKQEPVTEETPAPVVAAKKLQTERITVFDANGKLMSVDEATYQYNSTSQLVTMSEVYLNPGLKMNDTTRHKLFYENGKVVKMTSSVDAENWETRLSYDNLNRLVLMLVGNEGDFDTTFFTYKGSLITSTNRAFGAVVENFYTVDLDSTHNTWNPAFEPSVERYYYNSTVDKAYEPLQKLLPLFYPRMELIRKTDESGETSFVREHDGNGYPVKKIETAPDSFKRITEYFY